jgi:hypothetical protein
MAGNLTARQERLVEAVEKDYEIVHGAAGNAETAVIASRSLGFTLIAALIGVAIAQSSWPLMLLAAFSAFFLYTIDGYYSWRAEEHRQYLRRLEVILSAHFTAVEREPKSATALTRLDNRLASLSIGVISQTKKFKLRRDLRYNKPWQLFRGLYPLMLLFTVIAALVIGLRHDESSGTRSAGEVEICLRCVQQNEPAARSRTPASPTPSKRSHDAP